MKKYLLSFLLISLTIIGDGYAASCEYHANRVSCDGKDALCLGGRNKHGNEWRFTCDTVNKYTCKNSDYVIIQGPYKMNGNSWSSIQLWHCNERADKWEIEGQNIINVSECDKNMDVNKWILGFEALSESWDVYVKKGLTQSSYYEGFTKAYSFRGTVASHLCKLATDKKCGRRAFDRDSGSALFCQEKETDVVNVYQAKNARWKNRTKDMEIKTVCAANPSGDGEWTEWGKWKDTGFKVFVKKEKLSTFSDNGVGFSDMFDNKDDKAVALGDSRVCLWCANDGEEPEEQADGTYKCVKAKEKCDRRAAEYNKTDALFCQEQNDSKENVVKVYQANGVNWDDRTDDMEIKTVCAANPSGDGEWTEWGKWKGTGFKVFVNEDELNKEIPGVVHDGGVVFNKRFEDDKVKALNDSRVCLWCAEDGMTPKLKEGGGYECVAPEKCGVRCDAEKTIYCPNMPVENDSSVFRCPGRGKDWQEIDARAWCCNKGCTPPDGLIDVGIWTGDSEHRLYVNGSNISTDNTHEAYSFDSEIKDGVAQGYNTKGNCTACPDGTVYSQMNKNCVSKGNDIPQNNPKM